MEIAATCHWFNLSCTAYVWCNNLTL